MGRHSKAIAWICVLASPLLLAGAWISAGKGSHAVAGGSTVTIDTSAKSTFSGTVTSSATVSINVASNSNRALFVSGVGGSAELDYREIDSVSSSLDGALTLVTNSRIDDGQWVNTSWWYIVAPTVGTHTITVVFRPASSITISAAFAISLYNVDQSTPTGTAATAFSISTATPTASVTLASSDMAIGSIGSDADATLTVTSGTERQNIAGMLSDVCAAIATNTGTGSIAISATGDNVGWAISVVPVKAAP